MACTMNDRERFLQKTRLKGACWEWTGSRNRQGYGWFWDRNRRVMRLAHRVAYELFVGPVKAGVPNAGPIGECVCHRCDRPWCVNPEHLFIGSQAANIADMRAKGRSPKNSGQKNPRSKLTARDVAAIRRAITGRRGERSALARRYGISTAQVSKIVLRQSWA